MNNSLNRRVSGEGGSVSMGLVRRTAAPQALKAVVGSWPTPFGVSRLRSDGGAVVGVGAASMSKTAGDPPAGEMAGVTPDRNAVDRPGPRSFATLLMATCGSDKTVRRSSVGNG